MIPHQHRGYWHETCVIFWTRNNTAYRPTPCELRGVNCEWLGENERAITGPCNTTHEILKSLLSLQWHRDIMKTLVIIFYSAAIGVQGYRHRLSGGRQGRDPRSRSHVRNSSRDIFKRGTDIYCLKSAEKLYSGDFASSNMRIKDHLVSRTILGSLCSFVKSKPSNLIQR